MLVPLPSPRDDAPRARAVAHDDEAAASEARVAYTFFCPFCCIFGRKKQTHATLHNFLSSRAEFPPRAAQELAMMDACSSCLPLLSASTFSAAQPPLPQPPPPPPPLQPGDALRPSPQTEPPQAARMWSQIAAELVRVEGSVAIALSSAHQSVAERSQALFVQGRSCTHSMAGFVESVLDGTRDDGRGRSVKSHDGEATLVESGGCDEQLGKDAAHGGSVATAAAEEEARENGGGGGKGKGDASKRAEPTTIAPEEHL